MLNSFLTSTLIKASTNRAKEKLKKDTQCYRENIGTANISVISLLYQYTNAPPLAYGSPAPKVAESILRSQKYNCLPDNGRNPDKSKDRQYWTENDGNFPTVLNEPTCNVSLPAMYQYSLDFLKENARCIDEVADRVYDEIFETNADILTRGRQTWDPFTQRSVTSPDAFKEMLRFFQANTNESNYNMVEWIKAWSSLFDREVLNLKEKQIDKVPIRKFNPRTGTTFEKVKTKVTVKNTTLIGRDKVNEFLLTIATEFCSYLKSKERSKLKRRAIASANMILRMFFEVIERFHLQLGKLVVGSTIAQGGVEKQGKIQRSLVTLRQRELNVLATEDATKWNECLAPACFAVMHEVFFNKEIRDKNKLPISIEDHKMLILREIMHTGIFLLSRKRIFIGQGHVLDDGSFFTRHRWYGVDKEVLNKNTREWYEQVEKDLDERDCLYSPYGMLMGMLNAASTTYGLVATIGMKNHLVTVRSSDDSITLFTGENSLQIWQRITEMYWRYKLIGINISIKKTRFFRYPFGEYTSWYIDGDFNAQYGVEISTIRPKGDTPHTDFHSAAIETNVSLREHRINNIGAEMMLALKISNVRRLWRIQKDENKRLSEGITSLVLADGGLSPWHSTNCFLNEIAYKMSKADGADKEYFYKISNPENPFNMRDKEVLSYSHEVGAVIDTSVDIPKNIFNYMKRPNKTMKTTFKIKEKAEMEACDILISLLETVDPSTCILKPNKDCKIADYLHKNIEFLLRASAAMTDATEEDRNRAEKIRELSDYLFK